MLKIDHISKTFAPGTVNEKRALNDLSLYLAPGDFVTVLGSNGAGNDGGAGNPQAENPPCSMPLPAPSSRTRAALWLTART